MTRKSRLTLDLSPEEYTCLKIVSEKLGVTVKSFILQSTFEKMLDIEDEQLSLKAKEILDKINNGTDNTIVWHEFKKNI